MRVAERVVVVTGAGSGIGEGLARRFVKESPRALILADIDLGRVSRVASDLGAHSMEIDVSSPEDNRRLVEVTEDCFGPIDLFCANAGYGAIGDEQTDPAEWDRMWQVNVMSHVHAARFLVPGWVARGQGYFMSTVSAAGLLTNLRAAQYSVTKHAALAFAEWMAITYADAGIKVSALCPMGVRTPLLDVATEFEALLGPEAIDPEDVAEAVIGGLEAEHFLILPHPVVEQYFKNKANDYERWLGGMRKLQRAVFPE